MEGGGGKPRGSKEGHGWGLSWGGRGVGGNVGEKEGAALGYDNESYLAHYDTLGRPRRRPTQEDATDNLT